MIVHGLYLVSGNRDYRGNRPGEQFVARLDANAERRAIDRGDIVLLERVVPALQPGSFRLPKGWPTE
jgi:hypothetical protein